MKKPTIVLASLLKPVNDTRMFEKFGRSLALSGKYNVAVIGYPSEELPYDKDIRFYPLAKFKRLGIGRLVARLKVLQITLQVKPQLLIVTTHELLSVAIINRILFGTKIIYDVQENYYRNILYSNSFPALLRAPLAALVRLKEKLTYPFITHYFLAEKGYERETTFFQKKFTVIENKCLLTGTFTRPKLQTRHHLLFSGTLAESTGVFDAITLAKKLHELDPEFRLLIIGFCAQPETLLRLKSEIENTPFIHLEGGDKLVPHSKIIDAIRQADAGIIYYPPSPHTTNSIPTKLYEYLAYQLPIVTQPNELWKLIWEPCRGAVTLDFAHPDLAFLLQQLSSDPFYTTPPSGVTWSSEEPKLLSVVERLLSKASNHLERSHS